MYQEIAEAWVKDLRSNPPKATGRLFDGGGYCCLGRLCVVLGKSFHYDADDNRYRLDNSHSGESSILPEAVVRQVGMRTACGEFKYTYFDWTLTPYHLHFQLTILNDGDEQVKGDVPLTLPQIADVIEYFQDLL